MGFTGLDSLLPDVFAAYASCADAAVNLFRMPYEFWSGALFVLLLKVTQLGHDPAEPSIACHTGRHSCFYSVLRDGQWTAVDPVLKDPTSIYK